MSSNFLIHENQNNPSMNVISNSNHQITDQNLLQSRINQIPYGLPSISAQFHSTPQQNTKKRNRIPKQRVLPQELDNDGLDSNQSFKEASLDNNKTFSPNSIGFVPPSYWLNSSMTFGELINQFFQRKNNANCRFPQKLYNALLLVQNYPNMFPLVGVKWITDDTFLVDKYVFGRLLGISACDGGLFHRQGNFPSHGFIELHPNDINGDFDPNIADYDRVRLLRHSSRKFTKTCGDEFVSTCKWDSSTI